MPGALRRADEQLRKVLPTLALLSGTAGALGAAGQFLVESGTPRPLALAGHLGLALTGLWWLRSPPRRPHLAGTVVGFYLATAIGTFVLQSGTPGPLLHLSILCIGSFYLLLDRRALIPVQLYAIGWLVAGVLALQWSVAGSTAILCGIAWSGGLALHLGRVRALTELDRAYTRLERETEERRRAQEQVLAAQKLESLGVMAGGVAHDFNNLLVGILGGADLALSAEEDAKTRRFALETIREASLSAKELCSKMLDFAGGRPVHLVAVDLEGVVREAIRLSAPAIPEGVTIVEELTPGLPPAKGDLTQLRQALVNVLSNAGEAMGEAEGEIRVVTRAAGPGHVAIRVEDEGPGIPDEIRARIFDPFFTTKFTGRGLGLATVAGTVRTHGGEIDVGSSADGTQVEMRFPISNEGPARAHPGVDAPPEWTGSGHILLVDDEPIVLETGSRLLGSLGFEVEAAASGDAAIETLRRRPKGFRAAIVDATMPGSDGVATLRGLRAIAPRLPLLLSSGFSSGPIRERMQAPEGARFLAKPYDRGELSRELRALLEPGPGAPGDRSLRGPGAGLR
ncbi:MAG: ATP-binding protein [Myxococcota bacterium]|nr:ATP-binding protein [Myxococcota bacterium]